MKKLLVGLMAVPLFLTACFGAVQDIQVSIDEQLTATQGEQYEILVTINNPGEEDRLLTSIDLGDDYLAGARLVSTSPSYLEEWDFSFVGFQSYDFQIEIPAGGSQEVSFLFEAAEVGNYQGALDVCLDTEYDCIYNTIFTTIE